jgi:hypothetical protein
MPIEPIVASEKMDDDVPDRNPTRVDKIMVGSVTAVFRTE